MGLQDRENGVRVDLIHRHVADRSTVRCDRRAPLSSMLLVAEAFAEIVENVIGKLAEGRHAAICFSSSDRVGSRGPICGPPEPSRALPPARSPDTGQAPSRGPSPAKRSERPICAPRSARRQTEPPPPSPYFPGLAVSTFR